MTHRHLTIARALLLAFLGLCLVLPAVDSIFRVDPVPAPVETRRKVPRPEVDWDSIDTVVWFPQRYTRYFDQRFGFRNALVRINQWTSLHALGVPPTMQGRFGRNGWLLWRPEYENDFRPIAPATLEQIAKNLRSYHRWLDERGIEFVVVVVPNRGTVYPEQLPQGFTPDPERSRFAQLQRRLNETAPDVTILYPRQALIDAKTDGPVYFRTDTHWTDWGEWVGYQETMRGMANILPALKPVRRPLLLMTETDRQPHLSRVHTYSGYDTERMRRYTLHNRSARITQTWRDDQLDYVWSEKPERSLPAAVILHDSFFDSDELIGALLRESFRDLVTIQYMQGARMDKRLRHAAAIIERRKPDVFVLEIVERNIHMIAWWPKLQSSE